MKLNSVQYNMHTNRKMSFGQEDNKIKPYIEAKGTINTDNLIKPEEGRGYLIHDNFASSIKYYFKDIAYDFKSIKDGFKGVPNDHEAGKINDIGMKMSGIAIATYLASITSNPKARLMEYIGLGSFLTSMSLFPKLAINLPAKIRHGFDVDKEYIDDQGRKKSVFQDSNYIPYDLYRGEIAEEDLDVIGDKMGIPRDAHNRHDIIKDQMRKIATQNNTLWMLTAGFATPTMAALMCFGIEKLLVPAMEKLRNSNCNQKIMSLLKKTCDMDMDISAIQENSLSKKVNKFLNSNKDGFLSKEDFTQLYDMLSYGEMTECRDGIKEDLERLFSGSKSVILNNETAKSFIDISKKSLNGRNMSIKENVLVLKEEDIVNIFKEVTGKSDFANNVEVSQTQLQEIKNRIAQKLDNNICAMLKQNSSIPNNAFEIEKQSILKGFSSVAKESDVMVLTEDIKAKLSDFAKIMGDYKANHDALDKCKVFKVGAIQNSIVANSYAKFEQTLLDILKISHKDLMRISKSETYAKDFIDKRLSEICKDEKLFKTAISRLAKVSAEMDIKLNGNGGDLIKDLITGIENNYNNTAKRLNLLGETFSSTIDKLVKEDVDKLAPSVSEEEDIYRFLDGTRLDKYAGKDINSVDRIEYAKYNARSLGSSKGLEVGYILDRYSGSKNSFNRILHLLDTYRRSENPNEFANIVGYRNTEEYIDKIIKMGKDAILSADMKEHILKFDTIDNDEFYRDFMEAVWKNSGEEASSVVDRKGFVTEDFKNAISGVKSCEDAKLLERQQRYLNKFRVILGDNHIDFTKPYHQLSEDYKAFEKAAQTRRAIFNLVAQSPVDMVMKASGRRYSTQRWVRTVSGVLAGVFGVAILAQFGFGKMKKAHSHKRQVNNAN